MISTIEHNETQVESLCDATRLRQVKSLCEATGLRQVESLSEATGLSFLSPDVELDLSELLDGRILRGRDAVRTYFDTLQTEVWQDLTMNVEAIADKSDSLVALVRWQGVGRGSGVPVDMRAAWVATLRDGKIASARLTLDREDALEAVG